MTMSNSVVDNSAQDALTDVTCSAVNWLLHCLAHPHPAEREVEMMDSHEHLYQDL